MFVLKLNRPKLRRPMLPSKQRVKSELNRFALLILGISIGAFGYNVFQIPHNISAGGVGSIALIGNHFSGVDIGLLYWIFNIPLIILGYFMLGGWKFVGRTLLGSTLFAFTVSLMGAYLPTLLGQWPITDNMLLNTIYGGIIGGIGGGLIFRANSTTGGTSILALVVQKKTGMPISAAYLVNDTLIIVALGVVFGWENALFGMLMLLINGFVTDYTMEGPSTVRTATIVTNRPQAVSNALLAALDKGVSYWEIKGGYTGEKHFMLMTTIKRNQVTEMQRAVAQADRDAFLTIGLSHHAHGEGFSQLR